MKKIYFFPLFCLLFLVSASALAVTHPLRYFGQPSGSRGSATPYGDNSKAGHYIKAGDAKIYYETYGEGDPLFVFHGGGVGSPYELGQIIDQLRDKYMVVVVSSRGHGHSEIGHAPISLKQKAEDMLAVMRKITAKPAPVLGFSDGAYTAYELAASHPEAVEKLAAIGAGALKSGFFPSSMPLADLEKADLAYMAQMRSLMTEPERLREFLNDYMSFWNKAEIGKDLLTRIKCPVLLIGGDRDSHAPPETVIEAGKMLGNSRICIVPDAGHAAFLDNFPVTWAAINQFFTK
ncbi:MAG: alpha/beta hydrolase [Desulfovibrio sp.]|nr:alpha/beta hydrolase [Desulfovibrio sp.]